MSSPPDREQSPSRSRAFRGLILSRFFGILRLPELFLCGFLGVFLVGKFVLMRSAATDTFLIALVQHDAAILAVLLFLYTLNLYFRAGAITRHLAAVTRAIFISIFAIYVIDVFAYFFFGTRLYISDAVTFSGEMNSFGTLLRTGLSTTFARRGWIVAVAAIGFGAIVYFSFAFVGGRSTLRPRALPILSAAVLLAAFYLIPLPSYVYAFGDKALFENFAERNASFFRQTTFSGDFRRMLLSKPATRSCHPGGARALNVLVVIVESLSAYHSKHFSGIEDWTPRLDAIAQKETALTNFYANGWTTIGGLISLLTGTFPFVPEQAKFNEWGSPRLDDFSHISETLPGQLAKQGYQTTFVGAGDLTFLGQADWLRAIGHERIIGNDDPRFDKQVVRGPFDSVPDQLLYEVVLDEMANMRPDRPYFITAQTFWSHRPFMAPDGSALHTEEHVIRMTDQMIGDLYDNLLNAGFFDDGVLFITGDHRAMEPYRKTEIDRFGASAAARVPAIIATRALDLPHVIAESYQQRDLQSSVLALVSKAYCLDPYQGTMLGTDRRPPTCVMHARGDDRDLILVRCGDQEGVVAIAADATAVASGALPHEGAIIDAINRNRLRILTTLADEESLAGR